MAKQTSHRIQAALALGIVAILALAGCSSGASSSDSAPVARNSMGGDSSLQKMDGESVQPDMGFSAPEDATAKVAEEETAEILTASIELRVKDPREIASAIRTLTSDAKGSVSYAVERPGNEFEYGSAQLILRLPPESLQGVLEAIEDYGVVVNSESGSQDVSRQKTDYEIRIESLRTSIGRLNGLIAESKTTADLIEIERELQARESELEMMTAALADLNDSISYATLSVTLTAENKDALPQKVDPENFFTGFQRGLESIGAFGAGLLVFLGLSLPWILALAILGSIAMIFLIPLRNKRRRNSAKVSTGPSAPVEIRRTESETEAMKGSDGSAPTQEG